MVEWEFYCRPRFMAANPVWSTIEDAPRKSMSAQDAGRKISEVREEPNAILWNIYLFVLPLIFR